jgi:hypothetical protein
MGRSASRPAESHADTSIRLSLGARQGLGNHAIRVEDFYAGACMWLFIAERLIDRFGNNGSCRGSWPTWKATRNFRYQRYFHATATRTTAAMTNSAICTDKLLAKPPLLFICVFIWISP